MKWVSERYALVGVHAPSTPTEEVKMFSENLSRGQMRVVLLVLAAAIVSVVSVVSARTERPATFDERFCAECWSLPAKAE
jgi:hypothetical protein